MSNPRRKFLTLNLLLILAMAIFAPGCDSSGSDDELDPVSLFLLTGGLVGTTPGGTSVTQPTLQFKLGMSTCGSANGQFGYSAPTGASGITVDINGTIYVADSANHRIKVFDSFGNFMLAFGSFGTGDGQFNTPKDVAVDQFGNLYVVDASNTRIQKFTTGGTFQSKWGSSGTGNGQFQIPWSIAADQIGNVYVAETGSNYRVQKFDPAGNYVTQWGGNGTGDGQFSNTSGIDVAFDGTVYVGDQNGSSGRVQLFTSDGNFLTKFTALPKDLAVDQAGHIHIPTGGSTTTYDSNGGTVGLSYNVSDGMVGACASATSCSSVFNVAVDNNLRVYSVAPRNCAVYVWQR